MGFGSSFKSAVKPFKKVAGPALAFANPLTFGAFGMGNLRSQPALPGYPGTPSTPLNNYHSPVFDYSRIDSALNNPLFQKGQDLLSYDYLNNPEMKALLSNIDEQGGINYDKLTSTASALASRRGLAGSSIEQFGVNQAGVGARQATIDARNQVLLQAAQRQQAARDLAAQALFQQGQAGIAGEYGLAGQNAQLNSDELASLRNMFLGERGIELGYGNITQADRASRRANNPLNLLISGVGSGATAAIAPF